MSGKMIGLRQDDQGQITTALVMLFAVLLVAFALFAAKLGQATDQKSQVQSAADAAALAGAQRIAHDSPQLILEALQGEEHDNECDVGRPDAEVFARRAGAQVVDYCYDANSGTVQVSVKSSTNSVSGSPATAKAGARVGLALGQCTRLKKKSPGSGFSEMSAPTAAPASSTAPPEVKGFKEDAFCGDIRITIAHKGPNDKIKFDLRDSDIRDLFTPALTS